MITDYDRSGWFGASDTKNIMLDNHDTKTWQEFWDEKCGRTEKNISTRATYTGSLYEHPILEAIDKDINLDRQIVLENMRLRVNYDGDKDGIIYEVKTHRGDKDFLTKNALYQFMPKHIFGQAQVQMFVWKTAQENGLEIPEFKKLYIVEYPLYKEDYEQEPSVDFNRIKFHKISYDRGFIKQYKKKLLPLVERLLEEYNGEET